MDERNVRKVVELGRILIKEELRAKYQQIAQILKVPSEERTAEQINVLTFSPEVVQRCELNKKKLDLSKSREQEVLDSPQVLEDKCLKLTQAVLRANSLVVFTGAGISTAAAIPDYRGPNGVWKKKQKGETIQALDLSDSDPTFTHMALAKLMETGKLKYIVSQNCDGLHLRSGVDRGKLSEIHGNMFIEVCCKCEENKEYVRLFDVTERTGVRKHTTGRRCHNCDADLRDTIVHFGEKGGMESPYNWEQARAAAENSDVIICLGTSLKVLRKYTCLWNMDKAKNKRPDLYIVNLQWTPKDDVAKLKIHGSCLTLTFLLITSMIPGEKLEVEASTLGDYNENGRCDDVMSLLMHHLGAQVPTYNKLLDPIFRMTVQLKQEEVDTCSKKVLSYHWDHSYNEGSATRSKSDHSVLPSTSNSSASQDQVPTAPGWYGQGYRAKRTKKNRLT